MSSSIDKINAVIEERIAEDQANVCARLDLDSDGASTANELNIDNGRKRRISDTVDYSEDFEWETTKYFHENWLSLIDSNQHDLIPVYDLKPSHIQPPASWRIDDFFKKI